MIRPSLKACSVLRKAATTRSYAVQAPGAPRLQVFDRRTKWLQKERAAANVQTSRRVDYLRDEVAARLCERLLVRKPACSRFRHPLTLCKGHQSKLRKCPRLRGQCMQCRSSPDQSTERRRLRCTPTQGCASPLKPHWPLDSRRLLLNILTQRCRGAVQQGAEHYKRSTAR